MNKLTRDQKFVFVRLFSDEIFDLKSKSESKSIYSKKLKNSVYDVSIIPYESVKLYDSMPLRDIVSYSKSFDVVENRVKIEDVF